MESGSSCFSPCREFLYMRYSILCDVLCIQRLLMLFWFVFTMAVERIVRLAAYICGQRILGQAP